MWLRSWKLVYIFIVHCYKLPLWFFYTIILWYQSTYICTGPTSSWDHVQASSVWERHAGTVRREKLMGTAMSGLGRYLCSNSVGAKCILYKMSYGLIFISFYYESCTVHHQIGQEIVHALPYWTTSKHNFDHVSTITDFYLMNSQLAVSTVLS